MSDRHKALAEALREVARQHTGSHHAVMRDAADALDQPPVKRVFVSRMTTSREDDTKFEHFTSVENDRGRVMSFWMHHNPMHALFEATELADFLGVEVEPLVIDGESVKLGEIEQSIIDMHREDFGL